MLTPPFGRHISSCMYTLKLNRQILPFLHFTNILDLTYELLLPQLGRQQLGRANN